MYTTFEWDSEKASSNLRKHGVSFEVAALAFTDPFARYELDRVKDGEQRWWLVGRVAGELILVVAHTVREEVSGAEPCEIVRIISARKAERNERRLYEQADGASRH